MRGERITRRLSLEDIIREEAAKLAARAAPAQEGGFLGINSIKDLTEFIREINRAASLFNQNRQPEQPAVVRLPEGEGGSINKDHLKLSAVPSINYGVSPVQSINYAGIVDQIIAAFDAIILTAGDIRLSEAKTMIEENRETVIAVIRQQIEGGTQ